LGESPWTYRSPDRRGGVTVWSGGPEKDLREVIEAQLVTKMGKKT